MSVSIENELQYDRRRTRCGGRIAAVVIFGLMFLATIATAQPVWQRMTTSASTGRAVPSTGVIAEAPDGSGGFGRIDLGQPRLLAATFAGQVYVDGPPDGNVQVSTDSGATWRASGLGLSAAAVAVTPGGVILANSHRPEDFFSRGVLYISRDSGATWEIPLPDLELELMRVAPNGFIYLAGRVTETDSTTGATNGRDLFLRSTDDGVSWSTLLDSGQVVDLFISLSSQLYYSIAYGGDSRSWIDVFSSDNGESWMKLERLHLYLSPRYRLSLPAGDVIATMFDTLYRSAAGGSAWHSIQFDLPYNRIGTMLASRHGYIFAYIFAGIYRASIASAGIEDVVAARSPGTRLKSPRPHPVMASSTIPLLLDAPLQVRVTLTDLLGHEVRLLHDGMLPAGTTELALDRVDLGAGVYVVVVRSAGGVVSRMILVE